jgi:uncharacterized protein YydD (DUF2326 family)
VENCEVKQEPNQMNYCELARLLKVTAEAIEKIPSSILRQVEPEVGMAINELESQAIKINAYVKEFDKVLEQAETDLFDQMEKHYKKVEEQRKVINEKIKHLPAIAEPPQIPWKIEELIKTAQSLAYMDDKTFERLIKVLETFIKNEPQ